MKRLAMRSIALLSLFGMLWVSSGCVRRSIVIETDPPSADVWINERWVGKTPLTYEFITHGRYKFRLAKSGFRDLVAREMVRAPFYQWIPFDFFFEILWPFSLEDRHLFRYTLIPMPPDERLGPSPSFETLLADLQSPDPTRRRSACIALAKMHDLESVPYLQQAAQDPDPSVRAMALQAVRVLKGSDAIGQLIDALRFDPDPEVRWQAARELEILGDRHAVDALLVALEDRDPWVRAGAAEALKTMADPKTLWPLIRALNDSDTAVRRAAVEGLGRIKDPVAVSPLIRMLFHRDFQTARKAAQSLKLIGDPSAGPALVRTLSHWDPVLRGIATEALIEMADPRVVPDLLKALRSYRPWTREHAASVLGRLNDPRAIEPLRRAWVRESNDRTRAAIRKALDELEGSS
jgi:HEAT repeat protein